MPTPLKQPRWTEQDRGYETPCWIWLLARGRDGYGLVKRDGKLRPAHRVAYEDEFGPIPDGLQIHHLCHIVDCVRPSHLKPVTRRENARRRTIPDEAFVDVILSPEDGSVLARKHGFSTGVVSIIRRTVEVIERFDLH